MDLYLVTKNRHKYEEVKSIIEQYGLSLYQIKDDKNEPKGKNLKEIALSNARYFYEKYNKPILIDDTGVFFKAYRDFPGSSPKLVFDSIGYKGILKLLEGEDRRANFRTEVGLCDGKHHLCFSGSLNGMISEKVYGENIDVLPYERIFIYRNKPLCFFSRDEKNKISHRAKAFVKFATWFRKEKADRA
jgi:XTP/dITP diphosphohydrolase